MLCANQTSPFQNSNRPPIAWHFADCRLTPKDYRMSHLADTTKEVVLVALFGSAVHYSGAGVQNEMDELKCRVETILNSEQKTNQKLGEIEELLSEMKKKRGSGGCHASATDASDASPPNPDMRLYLQEVFDKYNADKTGKTDYALESAGAIIVSTGETETYNADQSYSFLGVKICDSSNGPEHMIRPGTLPGECWAIKGSEGSAIIKLITPIYLTSVSLEHMPKSLSPTGDIKGAPKEYSIWGLVDPTDQSGRFLGQFTYNADGPALQEFQIDNCQSAFGYIKFTVHSNHGNPDFTCVYRLRVHGELQTKHHTHQ